MHTENENASPLPSAATLQIALFLPAVLGIGFAVVAVFVAFQFDRDISDEVLRQGGISRWERVLLLFDMPARRIIDWCLWIPCAANFAWIGVLVLWRHLSGDRIAVATPEGLRLHSTYSRAFLAWDQVESVELAEIGWLQLSVVQVTATRPLKAWLMPPREKIKIGMLRSREAAETFCQAAENFRKSASSAEKGSQNPAARHSRAG